VCVCRKIVCPGIQKANIPPNVAKAMKCFDQPDHPTAVPASAGPSASATPIPEATALTPAPAPPVDTPAAPPAGCTASPSPAVAARQDAAPAPDPCKCVASVGHPGAVFLCARTADAAAPPRCEWHDYDASKECQVLATIGFPGADISFVGPDFGGSCSFYTTAGCDAGSEVVPGGK
jgi:hypothetical protein